MTNFVQTEQSQGVCGEDFTKVNCTCKTDADCTADRVQNNWNGKFEYIFEYFIWINV